MELPLILHSKIIDFLKSLPIMNDSKSRQAFIYASGIDSNLQDQISPDESPSQFVPLLLSKLLKYGKLNDGRYALAAILETAKDHIGQDKREYCDSLLKEFQQYLEIRLASLKSQCQEIILLSRDEAIELIQKYTQSRKIKIGSVVEAPISPFKTPSYRTYVKDGKGVIYCHANGEHRGQTFYVRKSIGWFYEKVLHGSLSELGLPISNEESVDSTGHPTSLFEGGYIEWLPQISIVRAIIKTSEGEKVLMEKKV